MHESFATNPVCVNTFQQYLDKQVPISKEWCNSPTDTDPDTNCCNVELQTDATITNLFCHNLVHFDVQSISNYFCFKSSSDPDKKGIASSLCIQIKLVSPGMIGVCGTINNKQARQVV